MPASNRLAREKLVVVGNGMAGLRALEELLRRAPDRYAVTVIGAEPHPGYNRILLSAVLAGEKTVDDVITHPASWYAERGIKLIAGDPAAWIDTAARIVRTASGRRIAYQRLLLATGSKPLVPPVAGLDLPGVSMFRDFGDLQTLLAGAGSHRRAVVVGGGLLGLEAAWGLRRRGIEVSVVHLMATLMERQLDEAAGLLLQRALEARGIACAMNGETEEIVGTERVEAVRLADGRRIGADLVVLAIGIRPHVDLARQAGLEVNRGIVVDDDMCTSDGAVYALGECAEHRGRTYGIVAPLWEQAAAWASGQAGEARGAAAGVPLFTSLKITGINVFSAGALGAADEADDEITLRDRRGGVYKKLVLRDDRLVGAVLYGDIADGPWFAELIQAGIDVGALRDRLIFGRAFADAGAGSPAEPRRGGARPATRLEAA